MEAMRSIYRCFTLEKNKIMPLHPNVFLFNSGKALSSFQGILTGFKMKVAKLGEENILQIESCIYRH